MLNEEQKHQVKYFIKKFDSIPEERWCTGRLYTEEGQRCALGHTLGKADQITDETVRLGNLFAHRPSRFYDSILDDPSAKGRSNVADINNGSDFQYQQPTPKARILAALHDLLAP